MPDPFNGLGDIDPRGSMGKGGNYRHPTRHYFLGSGEEGLKAYNEALEEIVREGGARPTVAARISSAIGKLPPGLRAGVRIGGRVLGPVGLIARANEETYPRSIYSRVGELLSGIGDGDTSTGPDRWVNRSQSTSRGNCPTMGSLAADGSRCGRRAASVRGPTRGYDPPRVPRSRLGNCPYINSLAADGTRCGRRAASVRGATRGYDGI